MGQGPSQFLCYLVQREFFYPFSGDNDDISARKDFVAMATKEFPENPLYPVTNHRLPHPRTHRDAKPAFPYIVCFAYDDKM